MRTIEQFLTWTSQQLHESRATARDCREFMGRTQGEAESHARAQCARQSARPPGRWRTGSTCKGHRPDHMKLDTLTTSASKMAIVCLWMQPCQHPEPPYDADARTQAYTDDCAGTRLLSMEAPVRSCHRADCQVGILAWASGLAARGQGSVSRAKRR